MHRRFFPKKHHFHYQSLYIAFPLSALSQLKKTFFSLNRFNLFALYTKDYGDSHNNMNDWLQKLLKNNGIHSIKNIVLYTHPRMLGYAFNPVSFWLCFNEEDQLIAALSEVTNTAGQKHHYLCYQSNQAPIKNHDWLIANKEFYVSPFMKIEGQYQFRFEQSDHGINFYINYLVDDKIKLSTYLRCQYHRFHNGNLLLYFVKFPFATLKTTLLIHYHAVRLALKKISWDKYPKALKNNFTISPNEKKNI